MVFKKKIIYNNSIINNTNIIINQELENNINCNMCFFRWFSLLSNDSKSSSKS